MDVETDGTEGDQTGTEIGMPILKDDGRGQGHRDRRDRGKTKSTRGIEYWPPVGLYLNFEIPSLTNQVSQT